MIQANTPRHGPLGREYFIQIFQRCPWCGCSTSMDYKGFLFCENREWCGARWTVFGVPIKRGKCNSYSTKRKP